VITLDGERLGLAQITAIAGGAPVRLGQPGRERARLGHELAAHVAAGRTVYGRTTGVGANKDVAVAASDGLGHAERLLHSHATSAGPLRDARRVRATLAIRLNQLAAGGSGARPEILDGLAALLESGTVPPVREHGGFGTGDLGPLATIALAVPGVRWSADDALPFLSSNAATLADSALATSDLLLLASAGIAVAATTFIAVDGQHEAFAQAVERATPYDGARLVCAAMRRLAAPDARLPRRLQDPFSLRCLPQVHGVLLDALEQLGSVVEDLSCVAAENPVVDQAAGTMVHHGAFHAAYLASALDTALLALAGSAGLSLRRIGLLLDAEQSGLPPFLGDGTPGASGAMGLEYVAGSALGDLRALAEPASLQTVSVSRGVEDDASFASLGARQALAARAPYALVLAGELVAAVRAVRLRALPIPMDGWGAVVRAVAGPDGEMADRDLTPDLETAAALLPSLARLVSPPVVERA
jgi:histidine ammonia-lyase